MEKIWFLMINMQQIITTIAIVNYAVNTEEFVFKLRQQKQQMKNLLFLDGNL